MLPLKVDPRLQAQAKMLAEEEQFVDEHKLEWLDRHKGQFVLVGKHTFGGFHKSYQDAMVAGTRMFGLLTPFLVREIK